MGTLRHALATVLILGTLAIAPSALADDVDRSFEQGTTALKAGKYDEALHAFERVWKQRKTHDVAANLGLAEMQLGKYRDAAEHLAFALQSFPVTGDAAIRKGIEGAFGEAKKQVTTLHLTVNVDGADVTIDGIAAGRSPIAQDLFVEPGARTIETRLAQYVTVARALDAKKGSAENLEFVLVREVGPVTEPSRLPSYIAFGVGGAALVLGAVTGGVAAGQTDELRKTCGQQLLACPQSAHGEVDAAKTMSRVSTAGFVIAGVGAAVGVTLLLIPMGSKSSPRGALLVGPSFVGVKGAF